MQRRQLVQAAAALLCSAGLSGAAMAFTEGTDYIKLEKPLTNAENTLVKVYSYDCPFCFKYDKSVDPAALPLIEKETKLVFKPMHLETKGAYGRAASLYLAMCMIRDEKAGVSIESKDSLFKKAKDAIYTAYHKKQERWKSGEAAFVETMNQATGITDFETAKNDPAVVALADSWKETYDVARIQGIPAYVVNGKYLIMTKSIRSIRGFADLVKELSTK